MYQLQLSRSISHLHKLVANDLLDDIPDTESVLQPMTHASMRVLVFALFFAVILLVGVFDWLVNLAGLCLLLRGDLLIS